MTTLKQQIIQKQINAEAAIKEILQEFLDETGYVPSNICVNVIDITTVDQEERGYVINSIDLVTG